jgi:hypothetical protein
VPSVRGRAHWYAIPLLQPAGVICPRLFHRRYFFVAPTTPILEDQTFYGLLLEQRRRNVVAALLNSSLTYLFVETLGRTGLGDGVLQHALGDMATLPVLDPRSLSDALIRDLTATFQPLAARPILPIEEEVKQGDRVALDEVVAAGAGMREAEMREVRETLVELASQRQERAQSLARSRRATSSKAATRSSRIAVACWTVSGVNSRS